MVDWNKDISLRRKERSGQETSIWKKEISFRRKRGAEEPEPPAAGIGVSELPEVVLPEAVAPEVVAPAAQRPVRDSGPVEEVRGGREVPPSELIEPVAEPEAEPPAIVAPEFAEVEPEPPEVVATEVVEGPAIPEPVPAEPVVSEPVEEEPPLAEEAPALVPELPVAEPEPVQKPVAEDELPGPEPEASPAAELPAAEDQAPALPEGGDYDWLTDGLEEAFTEPPAPAAAEPAAEVAEPQPEPAPPSAPVEQTEEPGERVPFWKKDISLSRKKAPKAPKIPAEKAPKQPKAERQPFWKKELSFSRKPASPKPAAEEQPKQPRPKAAPFWKRDLSFGKKKAAGKPAEDAQAPKTRAEPFWKKNLSLGKSPDLARNAPIDRSARKKGKKEMVVGLKIGASQLAAARVVNNGSPELVQVARQPLEDGVVVGGELRDLETLAAELSGFFARHKLPRKNVRLGIANNRIGVRTFEITGIEDPRQLANAIRFRAQETLPIPLEEAVLDWQVLSESVDEEGSTTRRVLLVVAYRELVDRYVAACKKAGLRLAGIDLEAFAMLRAVIPPPPPEAGNPDGVTVVVNVGHDRSTLAVSDGIVCEFTRVLSWGGQALSVAIARALDMTPSEVEPLKHELVLGGASQAPEGFSQQQTDAAADAVARELQAFARELVSSLRFYQNQPGSLGIGEIVVTGGTSHMPGFAAELERLIGVSVRVGDPLGRVKIGKRLKDPGQVGSFAVAVGLGIED